MFKPITKEDKMANPKYKVLSDSISYKFQGQRFYALKGEELYILNPDSVRRFLVNGFIKEVKKTKKKKNEN